MSAKVEDKCSFEWREITGYEQRRRIQNRLAQRKFRARTKALETLSNQQCSEQGASISDDVDYADQRGTSLMTTGTLGLGLSQNQARPLSACQGQSELAANYQTHFKQQDQPIKFSPSPPFSNVNSEHLLIADGSNFSDQSLHTGNEAALNSFPYENSTVQNASDMSTFADYNMASYLPSISRISEHTSPLEETLGITGPDLTRPRLTQQVCARHREQAGILEKQRSHLSNMFEQMMGKVIETYEFGIALEVLEPDVKLEQLLDTTMKRLLGLAHPRAAGLGVEDHRHEDDVSTMKYGPDGQYVFDS